MRNKVGSAFDPKVGELSLLLARHRSGPEQDWPMLLDTAIHQAMGLNSITPQRELRLLPVVSQPDDGPWLEMLATLCWHLQHWAIPWWCWTQRPGKHRSPGLAQLLGAAPGPVPRH